MSNAFQIPEKSFVATEGDTRWTRYKPSLRRFPSNLNSMINLPGSLDNAKPVQWMKDAHQALNKDR